MAEQNPEISVISTESKEEVLSKFKRPKYVVGVLVVLVIVLVIIGAFYYRQQSGADELEKVAALVNGEEISKAEFEKTLEPQVYFYTKIYPEQSKETVSDEFIKGLRSATIDRLIQEELLTKYLADKGIKVTDEEVRDTVQKDIVDEAWKGDWQAYEKDLKDTYNTNLENIMGNFRRDLLIQKVLAEEKIKPADFDKWYADFKAKAGIEIYVDLEGS